jgi:hypothetical protein
VQVAGDRRAIERPDVQTRFRETSQRVEHPAGAGTHATQDVVRGRARLDVAGVRRPQALGVECGFGVATDRGDRVAGAPSSTQGRQAGRDARGHTARA